jgi:hypothetical protein
MIKETLIFKEIISMTKKILILFVLLLPGVASAGTCVPTYCEGKITNLYLNGTYDTDLARF